MAEITVAVAEVTMMEPVVTKIPAVRDTFVMIEERSTAMPVVAPVMPAPAISSEEADTKSNAKGNAGATPVNPGHGKPAWIRDDRLTVHEPGVVGGNINDLWVGRFDDDRVALRRYLLLFGVTQMAGTASLLTQGLDGLGHILRLGDIRLAKGRGPREVLVHVFENRRELRHSLYAEIPVLFVYLFRQLFTLEVRMTLHPAVRLDNLGWIGGGGENLRNECVWVQGDRSDKLLQLLRGLPRGRTLWLLAGLACGGVRAGLRRKLHKQTAEQGDQNPF